MCVSTCTTTTTGVGFFLTGGAIGAIPAFGTAAASCTYDFLAIPGGQDQATPFTFNDRYCGGALGIVGGTTICSMFKSIVI
jgi:hypothetical protein